MELIDSLPYGLIACRVDGMQMTVTGISDCRIRLRADRILQPRKLEISFLGTERCAYIRVIPAAWRLLSCVPGRIGFDALIEVRDDAFRKAVFRALADYAAFIRAKTASDDLTGCMDDDTTADTLSDQMRLWFGDIREIAIDQPYALALSVDRPDLYRRFLDQPFEDFIRERFERGHLTMFHQKPERVYIGSAFCFRLFPEDLNALLNRCREQGLSATVVLPPVRESRLADTDGILECVRESCADELCLNDWGALLRAQPMPQQLLLGIQLNRRRKDARMAWKTRFDENAHLLRENITGDMDFMNRLRVDRIEYEACGYETAIAKGRHSLHLPFFQTNTSHACPLAAAVKGCDPGLPFDERVCDRPCLERCLLYPDKLGIIGRFNSLFGVDREILRDPKRLNSMLSSGIDRIVLPLL